MRRWKKPAGSACIMVGGWAENNGLQSVIFHWMETAVSETAPHKGLFIITIWTV